MLYATNHYYSPIAMITVMNQNCAFELKDRQQLERYLRQFALKATQVVVQSRTNIIKRTVSKPHTYDWFSLTIEDEESISARAKSVIEGQSFLPEFTYCIEIRLVTTDTKDVLVLETWSLSLKEAFHPNVNITSVYALMGTLMKSIIASSRACPAYSLSRRQSSDSYTILYRTYFGRPEVESLGKDYEEHRIGLLETPSGTLFVELAYRTEMTIAPHRVEKESPFMVKSDYFKPDMSPRRLQPSVENGFHLDYNYEDGCCRPGYRQKITSASIPVNGCGGKCTFSFTNGDKGSWNDDMSSDCRRNSPIHPEDCRIAGAFAPSSKFPDPSSFPDLVLPDTPFLNLMSSRMKNSEEQRRQWAESGMNGDKNANLSNGKLNDGKESEVDFNCNDNERATTKMMCSDSSECNDFVMVELRPAFARSGSDNDVGAFFRECQCAPQLASFAKQPTLEQQVSDITAQLAKFEVSLPDFDSFVDGICNADVSK